MSAASVRLTLTAWITIPVDEGDDPADYVTSGQQRRLERDVIRACRTLDGDIDCEVMDTEALDADGQVVRLAVPTVGGAV